MVEIWLDATDRTAVTEAVREIDRELSIDPQRKGEPLSEGLFVLWAPPLRAIYTMSDEDRLVQIAMVRNVG